jgi:ArsR family transcriptional regulator, arsenate/arsenite/antimonite-responsive transcriptional repressor
MNVKEDLLMVEVLKALGDFTRFRIIKLILSSGNNLCVNALSEKLKISQPVISQHLKVLKNAKIVESNKAGYYVHYNVNLKILSSLSKDIDNLLKLTSEKCAKVNCLKTSKK